jgi:hypothetical protein
MALTTVSKDHVNVKMIDNLVIKCKQEKESN